MQITIKMLNDAESEMKHFAKRIKAAKDRLNSGDNLCAGCKETGAVRRAALDLKNELTNLTKS